MGKPRFRSATFICRIDVAGFASIMFALVAMFLLPALIVDHPRVASVDLAKVSHSIDLRAAVREDALVVAVERDGRVWFGSDRINPEHLPNAIRERLQHGAERKVYIRADARAKYSSVVTVLDNVRSAGIEDVAFVLEQWKAPTD